jgi:hypothetical protein
MNKQWFIKFFIALIVISMIVPLLGYMAMG